MTVGPISPTAGRRRRRAALALAAGSAVVGCLAAPAEAAVTKSFNITDNGSGRDGAAQTWGSITWIDSDEYKSGRYTKDVCPGDNYRALSWVQQYGDRTAASDLADIWHAQANGCGNSTYTSRTWPNHPVESYEWGTIWRVRVCVKVDNGGAPTCTGWIDNPYSNDPTRDGM